MADDDVDIHKTQAHPRDPHMWEAVFVFLLLIAVMVVAIAVFEANPHIPMLLGAGFGALMAMRLGRGASCQYARVVGSVPHVGMPAW